MPYFYLASAVVFNASISLFGAFFNKKSQNLQDATPFYTLLLVASAFVGWFVLFAFDGSVSLEVIPYSIIFGVGYALCNAFLVHSLNSGPMSLTSLLIQLSLISATIWGFFFWEAKFTPLVAIGLVAVVISLWLCLYKGKTEKQNKFSWKWLLYVAITFVGNSACTIVQRTQQIVFDGKYGNFFMLVAVGISTIISLVIYLKSNKKDSLIILKKSGYMPISAGFFNVLANFCVILLATSTLSPSIVYPVIAVGVLMITTLVSFIVFKEKMKWWQYIGIVLGIIATAILNIG